MKNKKSCSPHDAVRRRGFVFWATLPWVVSCATSASDLHGHGLVVNYSLAVSAQRKLGVDAVTDSGYRIFGPAALNQNGGGTNSYGGRGNFGLPGWVRVTWWEGTIDGGVRLDPKTGRMWRGDKLAGDYTVPVKERIPADVIAYVLESPRRTIRLKFRLKDDGVLFAWDVQENRPNIEGWLFNHAGGDFLGDSLTAPSGK